MFNDFSCIVKTEKIHGDVLHIVGPGLVSVQGD